MTIIAHSFTYSQRNFDAVDASGLTKVQEQSPVVGGPTIYAGRSRRTQFASEVIRAGTFMARLRATFIATAALLLGCGPVMASTPTLVWRDARKVAVLCLVAPTRLVNNRDLQADVCRRVVANAAHNAPLPVTEIAHGDPQVIASDTVALLVHASVQDGPQGAPLVAFSIRPFRATAEQTAQLFSAPPRAATLGADGTGGAALDTAIDAALSETLPWRAEAAPAGPQPLVER